MVLHVQRDRRELNMSMRLRFQFAVGACVLISCTSAGGRSSRDERIDALAHTVADSVFAEQLAPGVRALRLVNLAAPWRAGVLEVNLDACVSVRAVKGGSVAVGRTTTSALLTGIDPALHALAAVNADFFLFTPPGVPTNAHVEHGQLISGPVNRPSFALTKAHEPWIGHFTASGQLQTPRGTIPLSTWNRPTNSMSGVVDRAWGVPLDSVVRRNAWLLAPIATKSKNESARRYVATSLSTSRTPIATGDTLLIVGVSNTSSAMSLTEGDTVRVTRTLLPFMPEETVGGQPQLLRDSVILTVIDSVNDAAFRGPNPRTAIGYSDRGRRLLLAVIDGRQKGYSMGMTLRQTAELFRALGATHAINLDGGGSSAMVVADSREATHVRFLTHPSDSAGQRPVANALAVLRSCHN